MAIEGMIEKVSGPLVVAKGVNIEQTMMYEVARVGEKNLIGEVIELRKKGNEGRVYIQIYEDTSGIGPGEKVVLTGQLLSIDLGPGLLQSIYDGIQRPLDKIYYKQKELDATRGHFIPRGIDVPGLDRKKEWEFEPNENLKEGDVIRGGYILGEIQETELIRHRVLVPPTVKNGKLKRLAGKGLYRIEDTIAEIETKKGQEKLRLYHRWPVRTPRPLIKRLPPNVPLVTGQRVIDTFFPIARGGTAAIPGPFGAGKTVIQHQLAKWSDADIIVYIGCGERGNEMTDVLQEFPGLKDPKKGRPLMERTILIANTSNMPVAAREASVYTGITIAEYFRDMGYNVAVMADSTSRWAEAMREMSGRLEEMPGEEGYPAYLPSRIADFYERAGYVVCLGSTLEKDEEVEDREKRDGAIGEGRIRTGTLSVIGAVSPPGGDLSDPVVQATLKVVKVFWSLEDVLAFERHFPAIGWLTSYSLYHDNLENYFQEKVDERFVSVRLDAMKLLQNEDELNELRRIVGDDSLSPKDRLVMKTAKAIREDFLQQSAFDEIDAYSDLYKQYRMLDVILRLDDALKKALEKKAKLDELLELQIHDRISKMREIHLDTKGLDEEEKRDFYDREFDDILADIERQVGECCKENQESVSNEG